MSSVLTPPECVEGDERFVLRGVDWDVFESIDLALADHPTRVIEFADWARAGFGNIE